MTWKLPHSPREYTHTHTHTQEVQDRAVSRESGGYLCLRCLRCSFSWFHCSSFNNKCCCLSGNSEQTQGDYSAKETRVLTTVVFLSQDNNQPHSTAATSNLLTSWGWEFLHIQNTVLICTIGIQLFPKMEKHLKRQQFHSNINVQNEFKRWLCG